MQPQKIWSKKHDAFWCNGVFTAEAADFKADEPTKPEQPFGCEDFGGDVQRRKQGLLTVKTE